jgi:hypothetical protein
MIKFCTSALWLLICIRWTRKKHYFYYLTTFYPLLRVFNYHRKFSFLKCRIFCPKSFFFQKVNATSFRQFYELLKSKSRKIISSRSGVISILVKCLKKTEKWEYLSKYWVSWPDIMIDRNQKLHIKKK